MTRASVPRRLLGFVIDVSIIFPIGFLAAIPSNLILPLETTSSELIVIALTAGLLLLIRDIPLGGKSPGHYLTGTSTRTEENAIPSNRQLVLRNLPMLFWPLEAIGVLYHGFKKRFGDGWSGTVVVINEDPEDIRWTFGRWLVAIVISIAGFYLASVAVQFNLTTLPPYEIAVDEIHSNSAVESAVGEVQSVGWLPQGSVNINPRIGTAVFSIQVIGKDETRWAYVRLVNRNEDNWKVVELRLSNE